MIKNILIAVLSVTLLAVVGFKLELFEFDLKDSRNYRDESISQRMTAVNKSAVINLATVIYNDEDKSFYTSALIEKGLELMVDYVNEKKGGIAGKKVVLNKIKVSGGNEQEYVASVQSLCSEKKMALCIAPYNSLLIPSVRALTHYAGIPLVSPLTVRSEKLPYLEDDNFSSIFIPLDTWISVFMNEAARNGVKRVLIISPENNSYGDIFSTALERYNNQKKNFEWLFRINYNDMLDEDLEYQLKLHVADYRFDAVFYAGTFKDFGALKTLLNQLNLKIPIYTTDELMEPKIVHDDYKYGLYVPFYELNPKIDESFKLFLREKKQDGELHVGIILAYMLVDYIKICIEDNGGVYSPKKITEDMNTLIEQFYKSDSNYKIEFIRNTIAKE